MDSVRLDDECWKLLKGLSYAPKTPQMLSRIYGMPIADTWKRVRFLEGLGLVRVVLAFFSRDGRVLYFYQTAQPVSVVPDQSTAVFFQAAP